MGRVIDIQRRHMELGRIRLGEKGAKGQPQRLDTWRLTSASHDLLESAAAVYGGTVEEWPDAPDKGYWQLTTDTAVLDVIVPPGDPYSQYYELWSGGGCKRRCDGQQELLSGKACLCDPDERECKITTRINVMLPRVAGLGVWRLESHGYYAAAELPDALDLLQQLSGGRMVSGVLRIEQRSSKKDGRTNRYPVPVLDLPNVTLASLIGNQVVVNPPAKLEAGKPPLADGSTPMPADPSFDNGSPSFGERPALPSFDPPAETPAASLSSPAASDGHTRAGTRTFRNRGEAQQAIAEAAHARGKNVSYVEAMAKELGIERGKASIEDLTRLLDAIEQPEAGVPTSPVDSSPSEGSPDSSGTDAATAAAEGTLSPGVPQSQPLSMDDVLAAAGPGAEEVPPRPGTDQYKAMTPQEKANARAWWARQEVPKGARETHEAAEVPA